MKSHPFNIHIPIEPVDLWGKLRRVASLNKRTIKAEAMIAIERHLQSEGELSNSEIGLLLNMSTQDEEGRNSRR